jgi:hypothetical protein
MHSVLLIPAAAAAGACLVGASGRLSQRQALAGALAASLVTALLLTTSHDGGVSTGDYVEGITLGGFLIAGLPLLTYYAIGNRLSKNRVALGVVWLAGLAPLYFYLFFVWIWAVGLVHCPPGAYECPL